MLRCCSLSCASTHTSCYTAVGSFDNDDGDDDDDDDVDDDGDNDDDDGDDVDDDDVDDDDVVVDVVEDDVWIFLMKLKFRFWAFPIPPYKMSEKWRQSRAFQMPGTLFLYGPWG